MVRQPQITITKKGENTMGNMSYCRFQNTLADLSDCYENMEEGDLSEEESKARKRLIRLCGYIFDNYGYELE